MTEWAFTKEKHYTGEECYVLEKNDYSYDLKDPLVVQLIASTIGARKILVFRDRLEIEWGSPSSSAVEPYSGFGEYIIGENAMLALAQKYGHRKDLIV